MTLWDIMTKVANDDAAIRRMEMAAEEEFKAARANNAAEKKEEVKHE